ncbi:TerD family protein [Nocardia pseudovaccinii]|uniref:TerD family protein n=1 Tax=Nocardia pseudovaccinii TaxID=189540 RepID=UPI003D8E2EB0
MGSQCEVDPQALLLTEPGKIRTNDDFVFYNAAKHPTGAASLDDSAVGRAKITVALTNVEGIISRIVIFWIGRPGIVPRCLRSHAAVQDTNSTPILFEVDQPDAVTAIMRRILPMKQGMEIPGGRPGMGRRATWTS